MAEEVYYTYQIRRCLIVLVGGLCQEAVSGYIHWEEETVVGMSPSLVKGNLLLHCTGTRGRSCLSSELNPGKALTFPCL